MKDKPKTSEKEKDWVYTIKFEKNYDRVLRYFVKSFPAWCSWDIMKRYFDFVMEEDLKQLSKEGLLEMQRSQKTEEIDFEDYQPVFDEKGLPVMENLFRMTAKGFEYLNNSNMTKMNKIFIKLNKRILFLTIVLIVIGIAQITIMLLD